MKLKLFLAETKDFSQEVLSELNQHFSLSIGSGDEIDLKKIMESYDIFWFRLAYQINDLVLSSQTRCRVIVTPVTGIDHINEKLCAEFGIKILSLKGETEFLKEVRATAELTLALVMSLMRRVVPAAQDVLKGVWDRDKFRGQELYGKTLGIIGFGRLGKIVGEYGRGLGMKIVAYDIDEGKYSNVDQLIKANSIPNLLELSDIVSIHINYHQMNHHLFSLEMFRRFKPSSYLINTSRGGVINENALILALEKKWIAGAALDVIADESSFTSDNPLIEYARENNNLLLVPHIGGNTFESFNKTEKFMLKKLIRYVNGK